MVGRSQRKAEAGGGGGLIPALAHAGLRCFSLVQPHSEFARWVARRPALGGGLERVVIQCLQCPLQQWDSWQGCQLTCQTDICMWRMCEAAIASHLSGLDTASCIKLCKHILGVTEDIKTTSSGSNYTFMDFPFSLRFEVQLLKQYFYRRHRTKRGSMVTSDESGSVWSIWACCMCLSHFPVHSILLFACTVYTGAQ